MCENHSHHHSHIHHTRRSLLRMSAYGLASMALAACTSPLRIGQPAQSWAPRSDSALSPQDMPRGFAAFASRVKVFKDANYWRVESNGLPTHPMMIGIRSWQQQVPLPQPFVGDNAFSIPLNPKLAAKPISARNALFRGAIALAVNGVPIFNALNNRGEDAYKVGELDDWGGHCGRADDYHYHAAPLHLEAIVGKGNPIAYALDGFPLYGLTEPDGSPVTGLDQFNGHTDAIGNYHYHATLTYPYINGGLRGEVTVRDDGIEPQPQTPPVRASQQPLRGAAITDFKQAGTNAYSLEYHINTGAAQFVNYQFSDTSYTFEFVDANGNKHSETYTKR